MSKITIFGIYGATIDERGIVSFDEIATCPMPCTGWIHCSICNDRLEFEVRSADQFMSPFTLAGWAMWWNHEGTWSRSECLRCQSGRLRMGGASTENFKPSPELTWEALYQLTERMREIEQAIDRVATDAQRFTIDINSDRVSGSVRWQRVDGSVSRFDLNLDDDRGWYLTTGNGQTLVLAKDGDQLRAFVQRWFPEKAV
jgi:hypothetical protein